MLIGYALISKGDSQDEALQADALADAEPLVERSLFE